MSEEKDIKLTILSLIGLLVLMIVITPIQSIELSTQQLTDAQQTTEIKKYTTMIYAFNTTYFLNGTVAYNGIYIWNGNDWVLQSDDEIIRYYEEIVIKRWNVE